MITDTALTSALMLFGFIAAVCTAPIIASFVDGWIAKRKGKKEV